jgi:hypothetical protein
MTAQVTHNRPLNVVVAIVAVGSKITVASGTDRVKFALVIVSLKIVFSID